MRENEVVPHFINIGGKEFLLLSTRLDRLEFPSAALRRTEQAFKVAKEVPDLGTTMRFEEKPIEVDVEPIEEPVVVEEVASTVSTPRPAPPPSEPHEIPLEPPSNDDWRVVVRPTRARRERKGGRTRASLVMVAIFIIAGAVAALHFSGLLPLDTLLGRRKPQPTATTKANTKKEKLKILKPFADLFSAHIIELLAVKLGGFATASSDTRAFPHTTGGVMLRIESPVDWKTEKKETSLYVDADSMRAVVFGMKLKKPLPFALLGRVLEERLRIHLRNVKVTPVLNGYLCTARKGDCLFWARVWGEKNWVVALVARGRIEDADVWLRPLERMVTVLGESE